MTHGWSSSKRAALNITPEQVHQLLNLPSDVEVRGITADWDPPRIRVMLEGDRFEEVPEMAEAPFIFPQLTVVDGPHIVASLPDPE